MNLSDQVTSLELSKRLKELGVRQESYFCYAGEIGIIPSLQTDKLKTISEIWELAEKYIYSAFTVAELGEILTNDTSYYKEGTLWECFSHMGNRYHCYSYAETEANARAKMLIYLLENGLIKNESNPG